MAAPRRVSDLAIGEEELAELEIISRSRTEPAGRVCRARMLLGTGKIRRSSQLALLWVCTIRRCSAAWRGR